MKSNNNSSNYTSIINNNNNNEYQNKINIENTNNNDLLINLTGKFKTFDFKDVDSPSQLLNTCKSYIINNNIIKDLQKKAINICSEFIYDILIEYKSSSTSSSNNDYIKFFCKKSNKLFNAEKIPNLSIEEYVNRIAIYSQLEENEIYYICLLLDIFNKSNLESNFSVINIKNIFKIIVACTIISIKYLKDYKMTIDNYSKITGYCKSSINLYVDEMLQLINYNIHINQDNFIIFKLNLINKYKDYLQ